MKHSVKNSPRYEMLVKKNNENRKVVITEIDNFVNSVYKSFHAYKKKIDCRGLIFDMKI